MLPPTLASSEPRRASVARPSWPSRSGAGSRGRRSGAVARPVRRERDRRRSCWPRNRPCSPRANGMPRSTSCVGDARQATGSTPTSSLTRAAAVRTRARAGDTGRSPAIAIRGPPATEAVEDDDRDRARGRAGSVARTALRLRRRTRRRRSRRGRACAAGAGRARALRSEPARELDERRSAGGVVAERLLPLRRCRDEQRGRSPPRERPGTTVDDVAKLAPRRGRRGSPIQTSSSVGEPSAATVSRYQRAASAAPRSPGTRDGYSVESASARRGRGPASKSGLERRPRQASPSSRSRTATRAARARRRGSHAHEARVNRAFDGAAAQPATARPGAEPLPSRGYSRRAGSREPARTLRCRTLDNSPRRRRGLDPDAAHVSARARRLPRRPGARRRGGAPPLRRGEPSIWSCWTSCCRGSTGSRCASGCGAESNVPIIMLTARGEELDKVLGLELGADDYITKPFSIREFRSRVRALLRRAATPHLAGEREELIERGELRVDVPRRTVEVRGEPVQLTFIEFEMLVVLASESRRRVLAAGAPRAPARRRRLPGAADDRRARPPSPREDRARSEQSRADPDDPRRRLSLPSGVVSLPGGIRVRIVLVLVGIVAGALGAAYMIVVPSLERRLVDARLDQLETTSPSRSHARFPTDRVPLAGRGRELRRRDERARRRVRRPVDEHRRRSRSSPTRRRRTRVTSRTTRSPCAH